MCNFSALTPDHLYDDLRSARRVSLKGKSQTGRDTSSMARFVRILIAAIVAPALVFAAVGSSAHLHQFASPNTTGAKAGFEQGDG